MSFQDDHLIEILNSRGLKLPPFLQSQLSKEETDSNPSKVQSDNIQHEKLKQFRADVRGYENVLLESEIQERQRAKLKPGRFPLPKGDLEAAQDILDIGIAGGETVAGQPVEHNSAIPVREIAAKIPSPATQNDEKRHDKRPATRPKENGHGYVRDKTAGKSKASDIDHTDSTYTINGSTGSLSFTAHGKPFTFNLRKKHKALDKLRVTVRGNHPDLQQQFQDRIKVWQIGI